MTHQPLSDAALDQIFRAARTQNAWTDAPVSETMLRAVYDLARLGPTAANASPARFVFLTSPEAKQRLSPYLSEGNRAKTMKAPAVVIIANDAAFYEKIPQLFPHAPAAGDWFASDPKGAEVSAMRNGSLQGAYFIVAARALGLDCGPMSGFDNAGVDREFFAGTSIRSNFICAVGIGDPAAVFPRLPRLSFEDACQVL